MMFWYGNGMGVWGGLLMTLSAVVLLALLVAGAVAAVRSVGRTTPRSAEDILAERFARGEIGEDEYHRRLDTLRRNRRPRPDRAKPAEEGDVTVRVREIMSGSVVTVASETPIKQAAGMLAERRFTAAPVVDGGSRLRWQVSVREGVVTIGDVFTDAAERHVVAALARAVPGVQQVRTVTHLH
jgi:putative membrane protein